MRLREGWRILWRTAESVQIGVDQPGAAILEGLTPGERDLLLGLPASAEAPRADAHGPGADRIRDVLVRLGAVAPSPGPHSWAGPNHSRAARGPGASRAPHLAVEEQTLARLGLPDHALHHRATATVLVDGLGNLGARIALALADAGVGRVLLSDRSPVLEADVGPYEDRHVGAVREDALAVVVRARGAGVRVETLGSRGELADDPRLVLLVRPWVVPLGLPGRLVAQDVPHLPVVHGDVETEIGPLVLPGATACLRCVALARTDADPAWPALATQLSTWAEAGVPQASALRAAGVATQAALALLDGHGGGLTARSHDAAMSVRVGAHDIVPSLTFWAPHPGCGCAGVAESAPLSPAVRDDTVENAAATSSTSTTSTGP